MDTINTIYNQSCTLSLSITKSVFRTVYYFTRFLFDLSKRFAKQRSRTALTQLDDHLLQDIGITREEAEREARKSFWE